MGKGREVKERGQREGEEERERGREEGDNSCLLNRGDYKGKTHCIQSQVNAWFIVHHTRDSMFKVRKRKKKGERHRQADRQTDRHRRTHTNSPVKSFASLWQRLPNQQESKYLPVKLFQASSMWWLPRNKNRIFSHCNYTHHNRSNNTWLYQSENRVRNDSLWQSAGELTCLTVSLIGVCCRLFNCSQCTEMHLKYKMDFRVHW